GDFSLVSALLSVPLTTVDGLSIGMHFAVNCHEQVFATTPEELSLALAAYPRVESYGRNVTLDDPALFVEACQLLGAAPYEPRDNLPLLSDIPALVIAGQYDSRTPPEYGQQVAKNLFGSFYVEAPGKGHVPSIDAGSTCVRDIMLAFLDDPTSPPDTACLAEMDPTPFE
ncbi:MAG TPA: alpha/beta hydrolase, partial [Anaerolineales bacterium]|nr:alpha/beta hydrolase [Anaerolineales bacterium]